MSSIVLELTAEPQTVLLPDGFKSVVAVFEPTREELSFTVFVFDGVLTEAARMPFEQLKSLVTTSERGLELDFDSLTRLAEDTFDIWDLLLVGYPKHRKAPVRGTFDALAPANEVTIEICDSGSLRFSLNNEALAQRARAAFPRMRSIPR
jgi:hypothetical protein